MLIGGVKVAKANYNSGSHTVYDIKLHFVWITKYRYPILRGDIALRCRELLRQGCEVNGISIIEGHIRPDNVHMLLSIPTTMSAAEIMKKLKGRSSHLLQDEFPQLKKKYWGQHMWARGYFCGSVGAVSEDTIKRYIEEQALEGENDNFQVSE